MNCKFLTRSGLATTLLISLTAISGCYHTEKHVAGTVRSADVFKGLYSFGPEVRSLKSCANANEYWVADSSARLELQYSQMNVEKPYQPVYVEVQGHKIKSGPDGAAAQFDSTLIVTQVLKITKNIPANCQ